MKKIVLLCFALAMLFSLSSCKKSDEITFNPGTYEGSARGHNGEVVAVVTVSKHKIEKIEFKEHQESIGISDGAFTKIPEEIISKQTVAVDVVAGATVTSNALISAVKAALLKSGVSESDISKIVNGNKKKEHFKYESEVIVVGGGGAGMTAAYEVLKAGGEVLVLEKTSSLGGNTIAAGSALNGADAVRQNKMTMTESEITKIEQLLALEPKNDLMKKWQDEVRKDLEEYKKAGSTYLYDSANLHKLQTYVGGDYVGNPELIDTFGEGAQNAVTFLEELGVVWKDDVTAAIGATWNRSHMPTLDVWGNKGASFVLPQIKKVEEMNGDVKLEHKVEELIYENDKVVGVKGTTLDGDTFEARSTRGVIIATGGFGANVEMRQKYNKFWPNLDETVKTTNVPSATGDGIEMALKVNANLVGMEWIQMLTNADKQDFSASINNFIYVNAEGQRYVKEDGRRDEIASATLDQTGSYCFWITDTKEADERLGGITYAGFVINDLIDGKLMFKADTIEDLAKQLNMDVTALQKTIDTYNNAVDTGSDELGRQVFGNKIDKGPYYANYVTPKVHHTMGGIEINSKTQVLDTNGNIIKGLYAAGEVTGGIHGANRLGGNAIADVTTFGRIAGQEIMK